MTAILPIHIAAGSVGIVAGSIAVFALKGGMRHRRSGLAFVVAMIVMASTATVMSVWPPINPGNVLQALLVCYLVGSGLLAVRTPNDRRADTGLMLVGFTIAAGHATLGLAALERGPIGGYDAPTCFVFGSIALFGAIGDARLLRALELRGSRRITRHLWRMCFALFMANGSFFLGQADEFPESLRVWPVLAALALFPLAALAYWLWRVRARRSMRGLVTHDAIMGSARRALAQAPDELVPAPRATRRDGRVMTASHY